MPRACSRGGPRSSGWAPRRPPSQGTGDPQPPQWVRRSTGRVDAWTAICLSSYTRVRMAVPFEVLAEPNRRRILDLLLDAERPVSGLVDALSVSQPAVSKHLRVLRDAGLVDVRVDAQRRIYRVRPEPLREVDEWLAPYRRLWA